MTHPFLAPMWRAAALGWSAALPQSPERLELHGPLVAEYRTLDPVEGEQVDLVFAPVRPLAVAPDGHWFAVNGHGSRLRHFDAADQWVEDLAVPWGPVAVCYWDSPWIEGGPGDEQLLVVCRGNHALARLDRTNGEILGLVPLPSEPADVVVEPATRHAFVSCSGADQVAEVDLALDQVVAVWRIPSKHPCALALHGNAVLVAAQLSGNNSVVDRGAFLFNAGPGGILDLRDPQVAFQGLPDQDVFEIDPAQGTVRPVVRAAGTVLLDLEVHPQTQELWVLNTEAHNQGPAHRGVDQLRGRFASNRISFARVTAGIGEPDRILDLDDSDPGTDGVQYDPARTVGQPCQVAFAGNGRAYVAGMLTDNVTELDSSGAFLREWDVGSIPRGLWLRGDQLLVLCWGSNQIEIYDLAGAPTLLRTVSLGFDPTPGGARLGREVFYDASRSLHHNLSCATCHLDGTWDFLAWDLSELPYDDKGPLVTKTLLGLEGLLPYNWRGERADLEDFNAGFSGLLGGAPLDAIEMDWFKDYLFLLQQPANPNQDERRVVNRALPYSLNKKLPGARNAVHGQDLFYDQPSSLGKACAECHLMPAVTASEPLLGEPLEVPRRSHFKVSVLSSGVWRKEQDRVTILRNLNGVPVPELRPALGVGYTATGVTTDLKAFLAQPVITLPRSWKRDVAAFVQQLDSGLAPAVHQSLLLHSGTLPQAARRFTGYLLPQAQRRHCDLAVIGTVDLGDGERRLRWFLERASGRFLCEDRQVPSVDADFFVQHALAGTGSVAVLGLPVGMGRPWGVDADRDDLFNRDEAVWGTDPHHPDSDGDGFPDGHEVDNQGDPADPAIQSQDTTPPRIDDLRLVYVTTRVAKLQLDTSEPTATRVHYASAAGAGDVEEKAWQENHTVFLRHLVPGQHYSVTVEVKDPGGLITTQDLPGGLLTAPLLQGTDTVIESATVSLLQNGGGTLQYEIAAHIHQKSGSPLAGQALWGEVYVNGVLTQAVVLGSISDALGISEVTVTESGLSPGDVVTLNVVTVIDVATLGLVRWSLPDTDRDLRRTSVPYTGG